MRLIVSLIMFLISVDAFACRPIHLSLDERIAIADSIYVGHVVGVYLPEFAVQMRSQELFPDREVVKVPEAERLTIQVKETIKGKRTNFVTVEWSSCGNGAAELRDRVVVFRNQGWSYISVLDEVTYAELQ